jgi:hypothetical protein
MSLESALGHCLLSTVEAGLACTVAAETGGLGAALCATAVSGAALDCYDAGKETAEWFEQNYPQELPDPPPADETEPGMCIDPAANNDLSWNEFYAAGAIYLSRNANPNRLARLGFPGRLLLVMNANTRLRLTADSPPPNLEQARDSLVQLCADWQNWVNHVRSFRFTDLSNAKLFAAALNDGKRFAALAETFKAMTV